MEVTYIGVSLTTSICITSHSNAASVGSILYFVKNSTTPQHKTRRLLRRHIRLQNNNRRITNDKGRSEGVSAMLNTGCDDHDAQLRRPSALLRLPTSLNTVLPTCEYAIVIHPIQLANHGESRPEELYLFSAAQNYCTCSTCSSDNTYRCVQ